MIDLILDLYEQEGRLFVTSLNADGERYFACVTPSETDIDFDDETETGEQDNG